MKKESYIMEQLRSNEVATILLYTRMKIIECHYDWLQRMAAVASEELLCVAPIKLFVTDSSDRFDR